MPKVARVASPNKTNQYDQPPPLKIKCLLCWEGFITFRQLEVHCQQRHRTWTEQFVGNSLPGCSPDNG